MVRRNPRELLAEAERHVLQGLQHIEAQHEIIARLAGAGHDTSQAESLLRLFLDLQRSHEAYRDALKRSREGRSA